MPGDIFFDSGTSYFGGNLTAFVKNGSIPESRLDDMATRILAGEREAFIMMLFGTYRETKGWYFLHQDSSSYPEVNFNAFNPVDHATNDRVDVQADHFKFDPFLYRSVPLNLTSISLESSGRSARRLRFCSRTKTNCYPSINPDLWLSSVSISYPATGTL